MNKKRKMTKMTGKQKSELFEKLKSGLFFAGVIKEYIVKKLIVTNISKTKDKLKQNCFNFLCGCSKYGKKIYENGKRIFAGRCSIFLH
jgi:hypothetical protein